MSLSKPVGLLLDTIYDNTGDKAARLVMEKFFQRRGIFYEVLDPHNFDLKAFKTIVVGGGELIRNRDGGYYDHFRVPGPHILNGVGVMADRDFDYLNRYEYVAVRSNDDKERLQPIVSDVQVVPCVGLLVEPARLHYKVEPRTIGFHFAPATLAPLPEVERVLRKLRDWKKLFIPFTHYNNDRKCMAPLAEATADARLAPYLQPEELFTLIGQLDYLVSSSLHACFFAYANNVPFVAIDLSQSKKIEAFMTDRGLGEWLFKDTRELAIKLERLLENPPDYTDLIKEDHRSLENHLDRIASIVKPSGILLPSSELRQREDGSTEQLLTHVQRLNEMVRERDFCAALRTGQLEIQLAETQTAIQEGERELEAKAATVAQRDALLADKDVALAHKDTVLAHKDAALADKDAALADKDATLAKAEIALAERDAALADKDTALADKDATLAKTEIALADKDAALAKTEIALAQRQEALELTTQELSSIRQSLGFRVLEGYRRRIRWLFPPGSWRGLPYRALRRGVRLLLDLLRSPKAVIRRAIKARRRYGTKALVGKSITHLVSGTPEMFDPIAYALTVDWRSPPSPQLIMMQPLNIDSPTINWVIPTVGEGGGHLNIFRFVRFLAQRGFQQRIYEMPVGRTPRSSRDELTALIRRLYDLSIPDVYLDFEDMAPADITVATSWHTAYPVFKFAETRKKFYMVQDFEPLFTPTGTESALADNTYRFGFHGITAGPWLASKLRKEFGMKCDYFNLAVDLETYFPRNLAERKKVFFYARPATPRRGFELGVKALEIFHARNPDYRIVFAGGEPNWGDLPFPWTNVGYTSEQKLNDLYNESAAALVVSLTNCSLLPLDIMATGCPVVTTTGENNEKVLPTDSAIFVAPSPHHLAEALEDAVRNPLPGERLSEKASQFCWEDEAVRLDAIFKRLLRAQA